MAANGAALLLLAILLGILLGFFLATGMAPSGVEIGNGTAVIVQEHTVTIEKTVTETVTSTAWATRTETQTQTVTVTKTLTTTATRTVTATTTRTVTVVQAPLPGQATTAAAYYAEPQPPTEQRLQEQTIGPVTVALTPSYLVVEYRSQAIPNGYVLGVVSGSTVVASLSPPGVGSVGGDDIPAVYFRASPGGFTGYYPLRSLAQKLGQGSYDIVVYGQAGRAWACSITLGQEAVTLGSCRETSYIETTPSPRFGDFYQVAVDAINTTAAETAAKTMGAAGLGDPAEAAWRILAWADENMAYDQEKQRLINSGVAVSLQPPLETLRTRRGVCSDYAILLSTAALGAGLDAYILVLNRANHAAAAVGIGPALYVLDQHLPPMELQDYLQYYDPLDERVAVIHLRPGPHGATAVGYWLPKSSIPDTYPEDRAPPSLSEEARARLAQQTGAEPNRALQSLIELGSGSYWELRLPALSGIGVQPMYPLTRAYSPVFAREWADWMADYMLSLMQRYYSDSLHGSFWATVEEGQNFTYVRLYAVPLRGFSVEADIGATMLTVRAGPVTDAVRDVQLLLYQRGASKPCAGVTPPGYRYTDIPYIEASSWRMVNGEAVVTVELARLRDLASRSCGAGAWLGVWLRGSLVYGVPLGG